MSRLAFRSQLASIMEVLANAAVAEICRLVEEEHALCQRENRALRRKLHVLELRMARNPRVTVTSPPGPARPPPHDQAPLFDRQMDLSLWPSGPASRDPNTTLQDETPEVQLVEAEPLLVKEEKMEAGEEQVDGDMEEVPLIGEDGVVESHGVGLRGVHHQSQSSPRPPGPPGPSSSVLRGVEVSGSSPVLKPDALHTPPPLGQPVHHHSQFPAFCDGGDGAASLVGEFFCDEAGEDEAGVRQPSCSYSAAGLDVLPSTSGANGWAHGDYPQGGDHSRALHRTSSRERLFVCSYCGKAFNRPKKVEIHQRIHTGERPFRCSTCGKTFSEAGNMKKHQRVHTGEKPYRCQLCGKGFAWIRNLKTHQLKSHPDVYTDELSWTHN